MRMLHTETPHADFYHLKGLIASSHPELLELLTEAERRYTSHDGLMEALKKYGGHLGACAGGEYSKGALRCDCGYEAALAQAEQGTP